jgi:hypothetical protein
MVALICTRMHSKVCERMGKMTDSAPEGTSASENTIVPEDTATPDTIVPETIVPETIVPETIVPETIVPEDAS